MYLRWRLQIACATRAPHAHGHPDAADGRNRNRTAADAFLAFHSIADRPLSRSASYASASAAGAFLRHGEFPGRGKGGRRTPAFSASGTRKSAFPPPGGRWLHHEAIMKAHRGRLPPLSPCCSSGTAAGALFACGISRPRDPLPAAPVLCIEKFSGKTHFPPRRPLDSLRIHRDPARPPHACIEVGSPVSTAESLQTRGARIPRMWNFPTGSPPIARPQ